MVTKKSGGSRRRRAKAVTRAAPSVNIETAVIGALTSPEARAVTPLVSKVYLALLIAPPNYWDRHGVLHFTGEQVGGEWRTAWRQVLDVTGVASVTASKALRWMNEEKIISYYAGKNGYGIHIIFNKIS
ncbi:MAG: hypothetical protein M3430_07575 [Acidobacteriota bacterium]|nr:hypothetical protein [Acidobacteriota bacterium]